jgi:hypothetical protein
MLEKAKIFGKEETNFPISVFMDMKFNFTESEIEYLWTKDKHLLRQYTKLIDDSFAEEVNFEDSYKKIDPNDLNSYFYLGSHNDRVIAGVRMSVAKPEFNNILPTETQGIDYKKLFPEFDLKNNAYCEVTRYGVHKDYRNLKSHYKNSFKNYKLFMDANDIKYLFIFASSARFRIYNAFGKRYFNIFDIRSVEADQNSKYSKVNFSHDFKVCMYVNDKC